MSIRTVAIAALMIFGQSAAVASTTRYDITEAFDVSAYFTGSFVYDSTTRSLTGLEGSATQGGSAVNLTGDLNGTSGLAPALQADGFGGVTDMVCNGGGYVCVYLDINAVTPTSLHTITHLGMPSNLYVNSDVPSSGGVSSYHITAAAAPEPATWTIMLLGIGGIGGALRSRRPLSAII